jgi:hypothetical protein
LRALYQGSPTGRHAGVEPDSLIGRLLDDGDKIKEEQVIFFVQG